MVGSVTRFGLKTETLQPSSLSSRSGAPQTWRFRPPQAAPPCPSTIPSSSSSSGQRPGHRVVELPYCAVRSLLDRAGPPFHFLTARLPGLHSGQNRSEMTSCLRGPDDPANATRADPPLSICVAAPAGSARSWPVGPVGGPPIPVYASVFQLFGGEPRSAPLSLPSNGGDFAKM